MRRIVHPLLILLAFAASAVAWPRLPAEVPVHWNLEGEVDRWGSRLEGVLIIPAVMLLTWGMMRVLPRIDPKRANYARMAGTWEHVITLVLVGMLAIHGVIVATLLGYAVPMDTAIPLITGVMLMGLGNVLPRAKPNWWFGVRTPWTLSSERVWARTHRVAGYSLFLAGIALVATAFVTAPWARLTFVGAVVVGALVPVCYSFVAWRQENPTR